LSKVGTGTGTAKIVTVPQHWFLNNGEMVSHLGSDEKVLLEGDGRVHAILHTAGHLYTITSYRYGAMMV
jgi:hypothetical protein